MTLMELAAEGRPLRDARVRVSSMLAMGLGLTVRSDRRPAPRLFGSWLVALLANFVLMPFAALAFGRLLRLDEPLRGGTAPARRSGRRAVPAQAGAARQGATWASPWA